MLLKLFVISFVSLISSSVFATAPAFSASSDWQDLGGGKVRMLADLNPQTNVLSGAIEVSLEPGWKTYWRYPGGSGIPPQFDFSNSKAIETKPVQFPTPDLMSYDNGTYAGYEAKVVFPFEAELTSPNQAVLNLNLLIGVCSKICIPAQASLQIKGGDLLRSDPLAKQAIQFAKFSLPKQVSADDLILSRVQTSYEVLEITVKHKAAHGKANLFIEGPSDWYIEPAKLVSQSEESAVFHLNISDIPALADPEKEKLRFTLVRSGQGIETVH